MAYVQAFKNDIFISYSRIDNIAINGISNGWVDIFEEHLRAKLFQRIGTRDLKIWRDIRDIGSNDEFDTKIRDAINNSCILLSLTSPSSINSEYCGLERKLFYNNCINHELGISVDSKYRILNLLLFNIPRNSWPSELSPPTHQNTGIKIFKDSLSKDLSSPLSFQDGDKYHFAIDEVAKALHLTLNSIKTSSFFKSTAFEKINGTADNKRIFIAHTADSLSRIRGKVELNLQRSGFLIEKEIPPPRDLKSHDFELNRTLSQVPFSLHFIDENPGAEIWDSAGITFPERQLQLALRSSSKTLVWINSRFNDIKKNNFIELLSREKNNDLSKCFVLKRTSDLKDHEQVADEIKRIIKKNLDSKKNIHNSVLLNFSPEDISAVPPLVNYLFDNGIRSEIFSNQGSDEKEIRNHYEEKLATAETILLCYGRAHESWLRQRIGIGLKNYALQDRLETKFLICLFPPAKEKDKLENLIKQFSSFGMIHTLDFTQKFDHSLLNTFLLKSNESKNS